MGHAGGTGYSQRAFYLALKNPAVGLLAEVGATADPGPPGLWLSVVIRVFLLLLLKIRCDQRHLAGECALKYMTATGAGRDYDKGGGTQVKWGQINYSPQKRPP